MADVHNHGPEGGFFATDLPDITCPERRMPDGSLRGACMPDDLDPAAVEQPTAAQVLAAHGACYGGSDEAYAVTCSCDRYGRPMGYAGFDGVKVHAAHQAAALAAAGLLVTPEHDAQVAARALREAANGLAVEFDRWRSRRIGFGDPHDLTADLIGAIADRADRIERQEEGR